jgi:hypothetical protein
VDALPLAVAGLALLAACAALLAAGVAVLAAGRSGGYGGRQRRPPTPGSWSRTRGEPEGEDEDPPPWGPGRFSDN